MQISVELLPALYTFSILNAFDLGAMNIPGILRPKVEHAEHLQLLACGTRHSKLPRFHETLLFV
jgi:hypothetical protein